MFALDLNAPIVIALISIVTVAIAALIGPLVVDKVRSTTQRRKLRKGLYRELAKWYEQAFFYTKIHDRESEKRFFTPAIFDVTPEAPAESTNITLGHSILEVEENLRIGRDDLKWKLSDLQVIFDRLRKRLLTSNLYSSTLATEDGLQLFYQIKESDAISRCYEPFRAAFDYQLAHRDAMPYSRFLTVGEARELALLEAQLDKLKIACGIVKLHEDLKQIDAGLLNKMRQRKPRGRTLYPIGEAPETARWCPPCQRYADPARYWELPQALFRNACEYCDADLPTIDALSKQLLSTSGEKQKEAAQTLAKTYRYNKSELTRHNVKQLIQALRVPLAEVRENAATALMHIGKRLEEVRVERQSYVDLRDMVSAALIDRFSHRETEASVRKAAIGAIGRICQGSYQAGKAKKPLKQALEDDDPEIVEKAVWATGVIGDERLLSSIRAMCEKPGFYTQDYAPVVLEALGRFGRLGTDSVKLFTHVLADDNKNVRVRQKAASILGNIGDVSEVWDLLTEVAQDPLASPNLQLDAKRALASLSPQHSEVLFRAKE